MVPGLPNDHYHAFADPMVFTLIGLGAAAIVTKPGSGPWAGRGLGAVVAAIGVVALIGWNVTHLPPATNPDGGFPAGEIAAARVEATLADAGISRDAVVRIRSLPTFKSTEAMAYPLLRAGLPILADMAKGTAPGSSRQDPSLGGLVLVMRRPVPRSHRRALRWPGGGGGHAGCRRTGLGPAVGPVRGRPGSVRLRLRSRADAVRRVRRDWNRERRRPRRRRSQVPETRTVEGGPGRALEML